LSLQKTEPKKKRQNRQAFARVLPLLQPNRSLQQNRLYLRLMNASGVHRVCRLENGLGIA